MKAGIQRDDFWKVPYVGGKLQFPGRLTPILVCKKTRVTKQRPWPGRIHACRRRATKPKNTGKRKIPFKFLKMNKGCWCNLAVSILPSTLSGLNYLIINPFHLPIRMSPVRLALDNTLLANNVHCYVISKVKGQRAASNTLQLPKTSPAGLPSDRS